MVKISLNACYTDTRINRRGDLLWNELCGLYVSLKILKTNMLNSC